MNTISRTITGIASVVLGVYIIFNIIQDKPDGWLWVLAWGVLFVIIGIFIFFNKKEDDIEEINGRQD